MTKALATAPKEKRVTEPPGQILGGKKEVTKALGTDLQGQQRDKTPGGAPMLGWGHGSAVIQEFPSGLTVLPQEGDISVSAGSAALAYPEGIGPETKMASKSLKISGSEEQPPPLTGLGERRGLWAQSGPLVPPILQEWDGDLWGGHWAKALSKIQAQVCHGAPAGSLSGASLLFPAPQFLPAPHIPWASCSSRGDPTPMSCLTAVKRFETIVMAHGKILLG